MAVANLAVRVRAPFAVIVDEADRADPEIVVRVVPRPPPGAERAPALPDQPPAQADNEQAGDDFQEWHQDAGEDVAAGEKGQQADHDHRGGVREGDDLPEGDGVAHLAATADEVGGEVLLRCAGVTVVGADGWRHSSSARGRGGGAYHVSRSAVSASQAVTRVGKTGRDDAPSVRPKS